MGWVVHMADVDKKKKFSIMFFAKIKYSDELPIWFAILGKYLMMVAMAVTASAKDTTIA